jgi:hypothetical protein
MPEVVPFDAKAAIADAIDKAEIVAPRAGDDGRKPWRPGDGGLPPDCPVVPLGVNGANYFYLDGLKQLACCAASEHQRLPLMALFKTQTAQLYRYWPRVNKDGETTGWKPELVAEALMQTAAQRGIWDVVGRLRGPGAWRGEEGELVLHVGDAICRSRAPSDAPPHAEHGDFAPHRPVYERPGVFGRYVYAAAAAQPRPSEEPAKSFDAGGPGKLLAELLGRWNWSRGEVDRQLLLGWIGAALVGGALTWRPLIWITGDKATGKSTLHDVIKGVISEEAIRSTSDATAAGIWQKLGHASLPVAIDELEATEDNRQAQNVVKLARQASSGGMMMRGGQDHQGHEFTVRSCFLFSSILLPPMLSQDRARMAILELDPIPAGTAAPVVSPSALGALGRALRRRMLDQWPRFGRTLEAYRRALMAAGHGGRGGDQFGTLLACADCLLWDHEPDSDTLDQWAEQLKAATLAEHADNVADHDRVLEHLRSSLIECVSDGARRQASIGELIVKASTDIMAGGQAAAALELYGLKFVRWHEGEKAGQWLAVTLYHQGLARIFQGSHWAGRSGASGAWVQQLRRVNGALQGTSALRFSGVTYKCVLVPLAAVLPEPDK